MITLTDISLRIAGRLLIDHASVALPAGAKAGFVGRNGAGKTTLFRAITGELQLESGDIRLPRGARIGQVAQEAPSSEDALIDIVLAADSERNALLAEAETATDPHRIADIQVRLADIDAHSAPARAATILAGLGFDEAAQQRPASQFSGGWRMRVALAAVLFSEPDLLLLDEPTNYLDLEGTLWLETYLTRYPHTVLLISHDRDLLNRAVSSIVHLEAGKLSFYRGGYDQFERQRAEKIEQATKLKARQDAQRKHMEAFVERFRYKASKARQAQSRLKALARMQDIAVPLDGAVTGFAFAEPRKPVASPALALKGVAAGYEPGKAVLTGLDLRIDADDRIALLGANGNGKSTFAKLIAAKLEPQDGTVTRAPNMEVAYFAQHQLDALNAEWTAVDHVRALMPQAGTAAMRARVAQMGLATEKMDTKAANLSGGEKARLAMGLATFGGPHLLILDEPTNHLDIDSRRALVDALNSFAGAVILITHDRHLIEATAERLWLVSGGTIAPYDGDLDDYRRLITGTGERRDDTARAAQDTGSVSKAEQRKEAARRRDELKPMRKKINETETLVARLEKRIQAIDAELADPELYDRDPGKVARLSRERGETQSELARAEEHWLELTARYDQAAAS